MKVKMIYHHSDISWELCIGHFSQGKTLHSSLLCIAKLFDKFSCSLLISDLMLSMLVNIITLIVNSVVLVNDTL